MTMKTILRYDLSVQFALAIVLAAYESSETGRAVDFAKFMKAVKTGDCACDGKPAKKAKTKATKGKGKRTA